MCTASLSIVYMTLDACLPDSCYDHSSSESSCKQVWKEEGGAATTIPRLEVVGNDVSIVLMKYAEIMFGVRWRYCRICSCCGIPMVSLYVRSFDDISAIFCVHGQRWGCTLASFITRAPIQMCFDLQFLPHPVFLILPI